MCRCESIIRTVMYSRICRFSMRLLSSACSADVRLFGRAIIVRMGLADMLGKEPKLGSLDRRNDRRKTSHQILSTRNYVSKLTYLSIMCCQRRTSDKEQRYFQECRFFQDSERKRLFCYAILAKSVVSRGDM